MAPRADAAQRRKAEPGNPHAFSPVRRVSRNTTRPDEQLSGLARPQRERDSRTPRSGSPMPASTAASGRPAAPISFVERHAHEPFFPLSRFLHAARPRSVARTLVPRGPRAPAEGAPAGAGHDRRDGRRHRPAPRHPARARVGEEHADFLHRR